MTSTGVRTDNTDLDAVVKFYDAIARSYGSWHWQELWRLNERPIVEALVKASKPGLAVDIGCGTGPSLEMVRRHGHPVVGLDCSSGMLDVLRVMAPGLDAVRGNALELPFRSGRVSLVTALRLFSHIAEPRDLLREVRRIIRSGGMVIVSDLDVGLCRAGYDDRMRHSGVQLRVFRHALEDLLAAASSLHFEPILARRVCLSEIQAPSRMSTRLVNSDPNTALFFVLAMRAI